MADSAGDGYWVEQAQSWQAKYNTLKEAYEPAIERVKAFKTAFGVRERADGSIIIDFDQFVENLGREQCIELRAIIDEKFQINGASGKSVPIRRERKRLGAEEWRRISTILD